MSRPLVSIGVPVFNGQQGLARALESLLEQDYAELEIIISDNASTDTTAEICARYARKDPRIKYFRSDNNVGGALNFNRAFELSSGQYFMWAAHDDQRQPTFVSACVEKLEQCPEAVLCAVHTQAFVDGREELLYVAHLDGYEGVHTLVERYRETLRNFPATAIYGIYRASALRQTKLYEKFLGADMAMIQELSIYGDFVQVPEVLFTYNSREKWNTVDDDYRMVFGMAKKPWWYLPFVVVLWNNGKRVVMAPIALPDKLRLLGALIAHEAGQIALKILIRSAGFLCPAAYRDRLASKIYWRWMHCSNIRVVSDALFFQRAIKPRLRWASEGVC